MFYRKGLAKTHILRKLERIMVIEELTGSEHERVETPSVVLSRVLGILHTPMHILSSTEERRNDLVNLLQMCFILATTNIK